MMSNNMPNTTKRGKRYGEEDRKIRKISKKVL